MLLGAQVVSMDDQEVAPAAPTPAPTDLSAEPPTTATPAVVTAANPFTCNFTGAGLLAPSTVAFSSSSPAPVPMAGNTAAVSLSSTKTSHGPWIHASAEQLATRRILMIKQRSTPTAAVPDAASTTASTTPVSQLNPIATTAAPSFSPLSAPYTNLFGSYPTTSTVSTASPEPSPAIGKEGIEKVGTAAIAAWSSWPTNPHTSCMPYILLPYAAKIATLTERVRVLEACHPCLPCVVCWENPKNVVIFPYHHLCVCQSCSELITGECPVCRCTVESKTVVYVS